MRRNRLQRGTVLIVAAGILVSEHHSSASTEHRVASPSRQVVATISAPSSGADSPRWSVRFGGIRILDPSPLGMVVRGEGDWLKGARLLRTSRRTHSEVIPQHFGRASTASDRYAEQLLQFESPGGRRLNVRIRSYDDAAALRYEFPRQASRSAIEIVDERTSFRIAGNPAAYTQPLENYQTSHEHEVVKSTAAALKPNTLLDVPLTLEYPSGVCASITEARLRRYAGMCLSRINASGAPQLVSKLTPGKLGVKVTRSLPFESPWRVILLGKIAGALLESSTLYCLNDPNEIGDAGWIRPGKMTWPWWNGNIVFGGKPEPPIFSMQAQKHYIDFCADHGIPFHSTIANNTDTPWYHQSKQGVVPGPDTDVTRVRSDLDLPGIRAYADSRGVGLWTWVHHAALRGRVEEAFSAFERFGWRGMMVDFLDHDDQETIEFAEEVLRAAARHRILIHFHGVWKPTGLQRTFPNLMNHEGALNLEYLKWSNRCTPQHTLNLLFTRMVAGPMDYHAGGFRSVLAKDFKVQFAAPLVLGTRCHQLASYVCFDNPNPMVADYPEAYVGQQGFDFVKQVPTWWDETRILSSKIGRHIVTARRKGQTWYLGGMSAGPPHAVTVSLKFLATGDYGVKRWADSVETALNLNELEVQEGVLNAKSSLSIRFERDGGFAAVLSPIQQR